MRGFQNFKHRKFIFISYLLVLSYFYKLRHNLDKHCQLHVKRKHLQMFPLTADIDPDRVVMLLWLLTNKQIL